MCLLAALTHATDPTLAGQLAGWAAALGGTANALDQPAGAQPQPQGQAATAQGQAIRLPTPRFSGRHGGVVRVLARLLAPHWTTPIVREIFESGMGADGAAAGGVGAPASAADVTGATAAGGAAAAAAGSVHSMVHALSLSKPPTEVHMRTPSEAWRSTQQSLLLLVAHLDAHPLQWGRSAPPDAVGGGYSPVAAGLAANGGGANGNGAYAGAPASMRNMLFAGNAAARWKGMESSHVATREAEAIDQLVLLAKRAAEATAFLATLAPPRHSLAVPMPAGGGGYNASTAAHAAGVPTVSIAELPKQRLLPRLASKLEPTNLAALKRLTLAELVLPTLKDASGRPLAGKWDVTIESHLPKALFMELGAADGGGSLTAELQRHCPTFFSDSDQQALTGWSLLQRASRPSAAPDEKAELLAQAVRTFKGVVAHLDLAKVRALPDPLFTLRLPSRRVPGLLRPPLHVAGLFWPLLCVSGRFLSTL